ncbi:MAG: hypothetical protein COT73_01515 [Bdellovibrio sp. CG10_big_fil_rev_8_21_14_0_10_47_8]|nr:MAG: hypothetical protein COT73_01515 [Bdellovibrio sp. CG10_big_fil_rev_8_21_14_0_10_47_8]
MSKKKILFQLNQLGFGGTEKAILSLAQALDRSEFDLYLFVQDQRASFRFLRHRFESFFSHRALRRFQTLYRDRYIRQPDFLRCFGVDRIHFGDLADFQKAIEEIQPDLIHLNRGEDQDFYTSFVPDLASKVKIVETNIFGRPSSSSYLQRVDRFLFVSQWLLQKSPWAQPKAEVLYNPIEEPLSKATLRAQLGIPTEAVVLGRVGRPDLGDDLFVQKVLEQVYSQVENNQNPLYYLSLGIPAPTLPTGQQQFQTQVKSLPATTDALYLSSFYNSIDILLHRRVEGETFGMVNAEAMMHGKVVVSHLSKMDNAQVEVLGDSGFISDLNDTEAYSGYVTRLIQDPKLREEMGKKAAQRSFELFRPKMVANRLQEIYRLLLDSHQ